MKLPHEPTEEESKRWTLMEIATGVTLLALIIVTTLGGPIWGLVFLVPFLMSARETYRYSQAMKQKYGATVDEWVPTKSTTSSPAPLETKQNQPDRENDSPSGQRGSTGKG